MGYIPVVSLILLLLQAVVPQRDGAFPNPQTASDEAIELVESWHIPLTGEVAVGGGTFVGRDSVLIWPLRGSAMRLCTPHGCVKVEVPGVDAAAWGALERHDSVTRIAVLDADRGTVLGSDGSRSIVTAGQIISGAFVGRSWVSVQRIAEQPGTVLIEWRRESGPSLRIGLKSVSAVTATPFYDALMVQEIAPPFRAWSVTRRGAELSLDSLPELHLAVPDSSRPYVAALRRLPLAEGAILTITWLRRGVRDVLHLAADGTIQSRATMHAAIGFIASDPVARRLAAIRSIQGDELVVYRYE